MYVVSISSIKVRNGNAQESSDKICYGIDNIVRGFNLTLHWHNHVKIDHEKCEITVDITGDDAKEGAELLTSTFRDAVYLERDDDYEHNVCVTTSDH